MEVFSDKVECKVSAKRMWQAAFVDAHNCMPKALPHAVARVSYDDSAPKGFSHAGCVRTIHLHSQYAEKLSKEQQTDHLVTDLKQKLEEVDHQTLKLKMEILEGGFVGILVKYLKETVHIKVGDTPDTCVLSFSLEYEALSETLKPKIALVFKDYGAHGYKEIEKYLLTHNDYKE